MLTKRTHKAALFTAILATCLASSITVQGANNATACSMLTRQHVADFRGKVNAAIVTLTRANTQALPYGQSWNYVGELRTIVNAIDENAFLAPACKSLFSPSGVRGDNNFSNCFRNVVTPKLEYEMYWTTLYAHYNEANPALLTDTILSFDAIRDLLKDSRGFSNAATSCMIKSSDPLLDPN